MGGPDRGGARFGGLRSVVAAALKSSAVPIVWKGRCFHRRQGYGGQVQRLWPTGRKALDHPPKTNPRRSGKQLPSRSIVLARLSNSSGGCAVAATTERSPPARARNARQFHRFATSTFQFLWIFEHLLFQNPEHRLWWKNVTTGSFFMAGQTQFDDCRSFLAKSFPWNADRRNPQFFG